MIDIDYLKKTLFTSDEIEKDKKFNNPQHLSMAIASEAFELLKKFQETIEESIQINSKEKIKNELADILINTIRLSNILDISLNDVIKKKISIHSETEESNQKDKNINKSYTYERLKNNPTILNENFSQIEQNKELHNYYESIIAHMPNNVYWLDRNCVLQGGNNNLAKMFGLKSHAELIGLTYEQMTKLANWTEGQGESFKQAELDVMATGIARLNVDEPPIIIDDETRYFMSTKVPLYNLKKEIIGVLGISVDITERKKAEEELAKAKESAEWALENIVAHMPGHVYWKNKEGVYLGCNDRQAENLGFQKGVEII